MNFSTTTCQIYYRLLSGVVRADCFSLKKIELSFAGVRRKICLMVWSLRKRLNCNKLNMSELQNCFWNNPQSNRKFFFEAQNVKNKKKIKIVIVLLLQSLFLSLPWYLIPFVTIFKIKKVAEAFSCSAKVKCYLKKAFKYFGFITSSLKSRFKASHRHLYKFYENLAFVVASIHGMKLVTRVNTSGWKIFKKKENQIKKISNELYKR